MNELRIYVSNSKIFLSLQALSVESDSDDDLEDAGGNNARNDGTLLASDPPKPL